MLPALAPSRSLNAVLVCIATLAAGCSSGSSTEAPAVRDDAPVFSVEELSNDAPAEQSDGNFEVTLEEGQLFRVRVLASRFGTGSLSLSVQPTSETAAAEIGVDANFTRSQQAEFANDLQIIVGGLARPGTASFFLDALAGETSASATLTIVVRPSAAGTWNAFQGQLSSTCQGFHFDAVPLLISEDGSDFRIELGSLGSVFVLTATRIGSAFNLSGESTALGVTLQVLESNLELSEDRNELHGTFRYLLSENGETCEITDSLDAFRIDETNQSPLANSGGDSPAFELTATLLEPFDSPDRGSRQEAVARFLPERANSFTLVIGDVENQLIFPGTVLVGTSIAVGSSSFDGATSVSASDLVHDPVDNTVTGTLALNGPDGAQTQRLVLSPFREPPADRASFFTRPATTPHLLALDPVTGAEVDVDLDFDLNATPVFTRKQTEYLVSGGFDPLRQRTRDTSISSFFYAFPGRGLFEARSTPAGSTLQTHSTDALFNAQITDLRVDNDPTGVNRAFVSFEFSNSTSQWHTLTVGPGNVGIRAMPGRPLVERVHPLTGEFEGWVTLTPSGLQLCDPQGNAEDFLGSFSAATFLGRTNDGHLYFSTNGGSGLQLQRLTRDANGGLATPTLELLEDLVSPNADGSIPAAADGSDFVYLVRFFGSTAVRIVAGDGQPSLVVGDAFGEVSQERSEVALVGDRVIWTVTLSSGFSEPHVLRSVRKAGVGNEILRSSSVQPIDIFAVSNSLVFFQEGPEAAGFVSVDNGETTTLSGRWESIVGEPFVEYAQGPRVNRPSPSNPTEFGSAFDRLVAGSTPRALTLLGPDETVLVDANTGAMLRTELFTSVIIPSVFQRSIPLVRTGAGGADDLFVLDSTGEQQLSNLTNTTTPELLFEAFDF